MASLQKDLNITWLILYDIITDLQLWNSLTDQKDQFYSTTFEAASWRLQKKFVVLFRVIPDDSYCNNAADFMLDLVRKRPDSMHPIRTEVPSDTAGVTARTCFQSELSKDHTSRNNGTHPLLDCQLLAKRGTQIQLPQTDDRHHLVKNVDCKLPANTKRDLPDRTVRKERREISFLDFSLSSSASTEEQTASGGSTSVWTTPTATYTEADSFGSSTVWFTPEAVLTVPNPDISLFSTIASVSGLELEALDLAFCQSPSLANSDLSRTESRSMDSILFGEAMGRVTRAMTTPEGREKRRESLCRRILSKEGQSNGEVEMDLQGLRNQNSVSEDSKQSQVLLGQRSFENVVSNSIPVLKENDLRLLEDVVNLSSTRLSKQELLALDSCTKFHQNPKRVPYIQLIAGVECVARQLENCVMGIGTEFRSLCADIIRKAPNPPSNLPDQLMSTLKKIGRNEELIVTASDKGGKLIVLDSVQYASMCIKHLEDAAYERVYSLEFGRSQVQIDDGQNCLFSTDFRKLDVSDRIIQKQCRELTNLLNHLKKNRDIGDLE